jgi:putative lipoprotein
VTGRLRAVLLGLLAPVLFPLSVPASDATGLIGQTWLLQEAKGRVITVPADARWPYIIFHGAEKKATGYSGCNEFFGTYELKGDLLTVGPLGMTRRFCEGAAGEAEAALLQALGETRSWKTEKDVLLLLDNGRVLARFSVARRGAAGP